jgi:hypothetical protein
MGLAGVGATVLQLRAEPVAIYSTRSAQETQRVLAAEHLLVLSDSAFLPVRQKDDVAGQTYVEQSDAATARVTLASHGMLAGWHRWRKQDARVPAELRAALCRLPGVRAASVLRESKGVLVMLDCSTPANVDAVRALASIAHGISKENVKILRVDGTDLAPPSAYNPMFYSNCDPEQSEELRLSVQLLADELFGGGASKVFASVNLPVLTKGRRVRFGVTDYRRPIARKLHVGFDPAATVTPEQRQKFSDQLKLRFNYEEKRGDSLTFVDLPYAYRKVSATEVVMLSKGLSGSPRPLSYSFVLGLLALAPAGLSLALISYDLLRKHQVRSS